MRCIGRTKKRKRCQNESKRKFWPFCRHHWWQPFALFFIVSNVVAIYAGLYQDLLSGLLEGSENEPIVVVEGALPLHLWEKEVTGPDSITFIYHRLGLIVKLVNKSDTPAQVDLAVLRGCFRLGPFAAEAMLPEDQRLPSGLQITKYFEKHRATRQAIRASGLIREDSQDILAFGAGYVGILFPLSAGKSGAMLGVRQSISIKGNCNEIKNPSPQPAAGQVFRDSSKTFMPGGNWRIHYDFPNDLAAEFRDGRVQLQLFVGKKILPIEPDTIRKLHSIRWKNWSILAFAQMYEVPDSSYPPRLSN